jgi:putative DNA primase/helicase
MFGLARATPCRSASVTAATAEYLEAEDALAAWVEECCSVDAQEWTNTTSLFGSWTEWATKTGEFVGTQRRFAQALEAHGYQPFRKKSGRDAMGSSSSHQPSATRN